MKKNLKMTKAWLGSGEYFILFPIAPAMMFFTIGICKKTLGATFGIFKFYRFFEVHVCLQLERNGPSSHNGTRYSMLAGNLSIF
jgi:hypothetical protein